MKIWTLLTFLLICAINISPLYGQNGDDLLNTLNEKAKKGDVEAMIALAQDAEGKKDFKTAMDWYKKAEKKKSPEAIYKLALFNINGYGDKVDVKKGIKLLQKATEMNYPEAQATIANYFDTGFDNYIPQDKEMAYSLRMEAAKANNKTALKALESQLNNVSEERKIEILEVLTTIGKNPDAATALAGIFFYNDKDRALLALEGFNIPKINTLRNFITLNKRADNGDPMAFYELAAFYSPKAEMLTINPDLYIGPDATKERELLTKATQGGVEEAFFKLKDYWLRNGDKKKALETIETLANKGNSDAMISAGIIYANELNDYLPAYKWLTKAQESGNPNISLKFHNYGDEYISYRGKAKEIGKSDSVNLRAFCFGINDGKMLEPGTPDYFKYLKEMERSGEFIIDLTPEFIQAIQKYDEVYPFSEGLAIVTKNGKKGAINTLGQEVIPLILPDVSISLFSEGLAEVYDWETGKSGFIDMKGNFVINLPERTFTEPFSEGLALVYFEDMDLSDYHTIFNIIDKQGNKIFSGEIDPNMFGDAGMPEIRFIDGKIYVPTSDPKTGDDIITVYDKKGNKLSKMKLDLSETDKFFIEKNKKYSNYEVVEEFVGPYEDYQWEAHGIKTKSGKEILPVIFDNIVDLLDVYGVAYFYIHEVLGVPVFDCTPICMVFSEEENYYSGFINKDGISTLTPGLINRCWDSYNIGAQLINAEKETEKVSKYLSGNTYSNRIDTKNITNINSRNNNNEIYISVEQQAEFPGGQSALMNWLKDNMRYPESAKQNNIQGRVVVKFIIEKDGSPSGAEVVRGINPELDREALRIVSSMPKWQPGKNNGVAVRSYFNIPITFKL